MPEKKFTAVCCDCQTAILGTLKWDCNLNPNEPPTINGSSELARSVKDHHRDKGIFECNHFDLKVEGGETIRGHLVTSKQTGVFSTFIEG